jgi:hypothetical protein
MIAQDIIHIPGIGTLFSGFYQSDVPTSKKLMAANIAPE